MIASESALSLDLDLDSMVLPTFLLDASFFRARELYNTFELSERRTIPSY
jgi:hypothetical protein